MGLGSNLEDPRHQVETALRALAGLPGARLLKASRLYRTPPLGPPGQPDYVNAVALLETRDAPLQWLDRLQAVESAQGRRRGGERWGPRTLDLDLLLYADVRMNSARLTLPHPQMHLRGFVLLPLADCAGPELAIPGHGTLGECLAACNTTGIEPIV